MKKKPEETEEVVFVLDKEPGKSAEYVVQIPKNQMQRFEEHANKSGLPIEEVMILSLEINLTEALISERHKKLEEELEPEYQKLKQLREKLKI